MSKQEESHRSSMLLDEIHSLGWFRKTSDRFQIGLPDIIGCWKGTMTGIEVKAVKSMVLGTKIPTKSEHRFSRKQVEELNSIKSNGGIGVGIIFCGAQFAYCLPHEIDENGQVDSNILWGRLKNVHNEDWDKFFYGLTTWKTT